MLKRKLCEAVITWDLACEGPLLIRDERWAKFIGKNRDKKYSKENGYPDAMFMSKLTQKQIDDKVSACEQHQRTHNTKSCELLYKDLQYYVPGTSLRGPFRAQAELIVRSLRPADAEAGKTACDPFKQEEENWQCCSKRLEKQTEAAGKYKAACPACKLFGCAGLASRIAFADADIKPGCVSVYRDMIGIDRFTGGVANGANMRFHVLEKTEFSTSIRLTNFELWQLGLLAYVFRDFAEGTVAVGFGKSKGFGLVTGRVRRIVFSQIAGKAAALAVEHLGSLMSDKERADYEVAEEATLTAVGPQLKEVQEGLSLYRHYALEDKQGLDLLWRKAAEAFNDRMKQLQPAEKEATA